MVVNYTQAIRGQFFDITHVGASAENLAASARHIADGLLFLNEGIIAALMPWEEGRHLLRNEKDYLDYRGRLILPGFVDCHIHYPQAEMVGAYGEQLLDWLQTYTFPVESQYVSRDYAARMSDFFLSQLLSNGTTSALVFGTVHPQSVDALFNAAEQIGMRMIAGKVMMDRNAPDYLTETPEESYRQTRELILRWHKRGRLSYALTPRFAPTSTPTLLTVVQKLREEFPDIWVHTHLSENSDEVEWVKALWPEHDSYLDVYHHYRLTGKRSVFAHGVHLQECEWDCLHRTGSSLAFCPTSNLFLGSGLFNLKRCQQQGVRMGIGTDIGAGTTFNMLQTLAEAYKVAQLQSYRLCASEAFYYATLGGAHALDLDAKIGNFQAGKEADFVVIDPAVTPLQKLRYGNSSDIYEKLFVLMMLGDDRNIWQTWVDGKRVWQRGALEVAA